LREVTPEDQTVSAGVAEWNRYESPDALVDRADLALYKAKRAGRDRATAAA
jgi:diguanylate cyclase